MDLKEVRQIIKESPHKDFLNTIELRFSLPHVNIEYNFVGIINIFKFFKEKDEEWTERKKELDNTLFKESIAFFRTSYNYIDSFISTYVGNQSYSENNLKQNFTSFTRSYFSPSQLVLPQIVLKSIL